VTRLTARGHFHRLIWVNTNILDLQ
jgi:hypothetical protein